MLLPRSGPLRAAAGLLWFGAVLVAVLVILPVPVTDRIVATRGPLEIAATFFLALGAVFAARCFARTRERTTLAAAWILALFAWVKFDPGDWLLHREAESPSFYLDAAVPLGERAALAFLLGGGAVLALYLVVRLFPRFLEGWRRRDRVAVWGGAAVGILALSIVVDTFHGRMTWERGFRHAGQWPKHQVNILEETLELLASILFTLAAWAASRRGVSVRVDRPRTE